MRFSCEADFGECHVKGMSICARGFRCTTEVNVTQQLTRAVDYDPAKKFRDYASSRPLNSRMSFNENNNRKDCSTINGSSLKLMNYKRSVNRFFCAARKSAITPTLILRASNTRRSRAHFCLCLAWNPRKFSRSAFRNCIAPRHAIDLENTFNDDGNLRLILQIHNSSRR